MHTPEEMATLISTPLLLPAGLESAKKLLEITAKNSKYRSQHQSTLDAAQSRWDSESPARNARAALHNSGWRQSYYDSSIWYNRTTKAKRSLVEAIRDSGICD